MKIRIYQTLYCLQESFDVEESPSKPTFQHSFWRILLIICSLISFILVCIFNGLASRPMSTSRYSTILPEKKNIRN